MDRPHKVTDYLMPVFGVAGVFVPFGSSIVRNFGGDPAIIAFNSMMLMMMAILFILFQMVKCFDVLISRKFVFFAIGIVSLFAEIVSFLLNLILYVNS